MARKYQISIFIDTKNGQVVDVLRCLRTKTSPDVFRGYICTLWGCGYNGIARHLSEGWACESAGELDARVWGQRGLVMTVAVHGEGSRMGRNLEHLVESVVSVRLSACAECRVQKSENELEIIYILR